MRSAMRARGIALVDILRGYLIGVGPRVFRYMQPGSVVGPVDQAILEHRIRPRDALRNGQGMADLPRRHRVGYIDDAQSVAVPRVEYQVLEHCWIVVLLWDRSAACDAIGFGDRLPEAVVHLVVRDGERANHRRERLRF